MSACRDPAAKRPRVWVPGALVVEILEDGRGAIETGPAVGWTPLPDTSASR